MEKTTYGMGVKSEQQRMSVDELALDAVSAKTIILEKESAAFFLITGSFFRQ
jgi:hypothetical protein